MRNAFMIAAATLGIAAAGLGVGLSSPILPAQAQPAPVAPPPAPDQMHGPGPGPGPWGMGWMHPGPPGHGMPGHPGMRWHHDATFALLHRPADRALSGADVQKIAEAFLLWNGNHSWKITGVTEQDEATVGFSIATPSGDVIAHFTMNRHTGQLTRVS
jgi:hypothetical protein